MRLLDAHIGQQLDLSRAHLISRNGRAVSADQIALSGSMICAEGSSLPPTAAEHPPLCTQRDCQESID
jgi:hypothetical protein